MTTRNRAELMSLLIISAPYNSSRIRCSELSLNFGDGLAGQAAAVMGWRSVGLAMTSIPSLNVTPRTSFGNWLWPSRRRQLFCAPSSSLKTIASAVLLDRQPFDRIVRWRTVAKVLSMGGDMG